MKRPPIRGIVVAGNTLEEAQEIYRAVATGQDVQALHDEEDSFVVLSSASTDLNLLNPLTGADDLKVGDGLTAQMEFLSSDSDAINVNYTICTAGCEAHVLADDAAMLKHCPACASVLPELTAEEIAAYASGDDDEGCEGCQVTAIASGKTLEEAVAAYQGLVFGETEATATMKCGNTLVHVAGDANFDVYKGCAATTVVDAEPSEFLESLSSSGEELDAHHFVCASTECGAHVVSADDMPVFCPSCSSGLMEVEDDVAATASDDDGEQDDQHEAFAGVDEEDEDDEEEDDSEDDDEDDESDEEDEEDDEEDDDSDEDEDDSEDDEEDEDEEDEDEDDEDALTLSVSSVQTAAAPRRARNRQEARASVQEEEQHEMVAVAASFTAIASVGGELDPAKLEVSYAALSSGNTWFAYYEGTPFAKAEAASTKHEQIFNSEVFGRAFKAQASEHGVPAALENMGFTEIKPVIQVADYVQAEIAQQVEVKTQAVQAVAAQDKAELHDRFNAAMALAATGLSKNFFKGRVNPIITQLNEALAAVGLDNASALVAQAFAQNSDAYHKTLLALASEIQSYDLETQNNLTKAITGANDVSGPETAQASTSQVPLGRPVAVVEQEKVQATASVTTGDFTQDLAQAMSGLGRRR